MRPNEKVRMQKYGVGETGTFPFGTGEFKFYRSFFKNVVQSALPSSFGNPEGEVEGEIVRYKLLLQDVARLAEFTNFKVPTEGGVRNDIWGMKIRFFGGNGLQPYVKIKWLYGKKDAIPSVGAPRERTMPSEVLKKYEWLAAMIMDCMTAVATIVDGTPDKSAPSPAYEDALEHVSMCSSPLCHDCREAYDLP